MVITTSIAADGLGAEAFFYRPDAVADFPGVVFLVDIWGVRAANMAIRSINEREKKN